ncbi:MAG: LacI family transcriptional regulator [Phyllobacteriaceae bacterium]|nr:LacI family transcriptional regulator [Phyllobacteriaceae bacterium]
MTTVSRALADYSDVAEETRRRVREEAERIGYVPNATARRLQKGRADTIGIAAPSGFGALEDSHLSSGFVGAWTRLAELGQDLLLLPTDDAIGGTDRQSAAEAAFRRAIGERRVDGMLLMRPRRGDPRIEAMRRAGLPFALLDAEMADRPDLTAIGTDNGEAARLVCARLVQLGHHRCMVVGPHEDFDFALSRFEHFVQQTAVHGLTMEAIRAPAGESGGRRAVELILEHRPQPPPPLIFLTNRMTVGGLTALAHSPWVIGRHVTVIGFGDSPTLRHWLPAITVVQSPIFEMARHAVDGLMALRDDRPFQLVRRWRPMLDLRHSDGPPDASG